MHSDQAARSDFGLLRHHYGKRVMAEMRVESMRASAGICAANRTRMVPSTTREGIFIRLFKS